MKADLLDADASVRWAVSNFPAFQVRIDAWLKENVYLEIIDPHPEGPNKIVVARQKAPLPLIFNAEVGAYINAIRSSLDILAAAVGKRHTILYPDRIYFPVADSLADFIAGNHKGVHFINNLPGTERKIIEALKPYMGGNGFLWALHKLDIERKHRRLLGVSVNPSRLRVGWIGKRGTFTKVPIGWVRASDNETVLGLLSRGQPEPKFEFTAQVSFPEASLLEDMPVILALNYFADIADAIIKAFDF